MKSRRPRRRRGFTLMEVLLVLAILVILGSLVTVSFVQMQKNAYVNAAKSQVSMLEEAVNMYVLSIGAPPTTQQGLQALLIAPGELKDQTKWQGPYLQKQNIPTDPWNHEYQYEELDSGQFRIWSSGPNGISGDPDDIQTTL